MIERQVLRDVSVNEIKPNPNNPRVNEEAVKEVVKSIQHSDYISPIIVDENNEILAGNTRYKAVVQLGRSVIPMVIKVIGLTKEQKDRFILADNKAQEFALWDWDKLSVFDEEMLKDVGFAGWEIEKIFSASTRAEDDDIPEEQEKIISQRGDIWQVGVHRIMCGDSTDLGDIALLMNGQKAALGFTSPPYWVGMEYEYQKTLEEIDKFIKAAAKSYSMAVRKDYSRIVINTGTGMTTSLPGKKGKRQTLLLIDKWADAFFDEGWNLRHIRHWIKHGSPAQKTAQTDLIDQHNEFLGTFENMDGEDMKFDDKIWDGDITILETFYKPDGKNRGQNKARAPWAIKGWWDDIKGNARATGHVAAMPVELVTRHLFLYTLEGEIVLDIFLGSGTTMVACEKLKRVCYGMELLPKYVDLCIRRMMEYSPGIEVKCLNREVDVAQFKEGK